MGKWWSHGSLHRTDVPTTAYVRETVPPDDWAWKMGSILWQQTLHYGYALLPKRLCRKEEVLDEEMIMMISVVIIICLFSLMVLFTSALWEVTWNFWNIFWNFFAHLGFLPSFSNEGWGPHEPPSPPKAKGCGYVPLPSSRPPQRALNRPTRLSHLQSYYTLGKVHSPHQWGTSLYKERVFQETLTLVV